MGAAKGQNWLIRSLIILDFLSSSCCAHGIKCDVTQSGGATQYSVPKFNATNCTFSWTNITNHVLANNVGKLDALVLFKTNWSLTTYRCFNIIFYMRGCTSEGIKMEANCTTSCSGNAENQDGETFKPCASLTETTHNHWIIPTSVLILVMLLVILLCYWKRQFLTQMIQDLRPNAADEEAPVG